MIHFPNSVSEHVRTNASDRMMGVPDDEPPEPDVPVRSWVSAAVAMTK